MAAERTLKRFRTFEEARDVFNLALPDFRCPVCGDDHVSILGDFDEQLRTKITLQADEDPFPAQFVPTLPVICENCGYVSTFAEDGIRSLAAKRNGSGGS